MNKKFVLRVTDTQSELLEVVAIDLSQSLPEQLQPIAALRTTGKCALMKLYVGETKDYDPQTMANIFHAIGGEIEWSVVADTPATADINADLILNHHE